MLLKPTETAPERRTEASAAEPRPYRREVADGRGGGYEIVYG
jgi:hypothetical protein